jgi:uncharacterized protein YfaS (alpha-2-macroglobulin family)
MRRFTWAFVAAFVILTIAAIGQTKLKSMQSTNKNWKEVDSLINIGKPESAKKIVEQLLKDAEARDTKDEVIKAKAWLLALDQQQEDAEAKTIKKLETAIKNAKDPVEKAIWQNLTAKTYWQFLQNNRYEIYDRSTVAIDSSSDINTWDARRLHHKISSLFLEALTNKEALSKAKIGDFTNVIHTDKNDRGTIRTVYELIAFDALDYFQSDESNLINPTYRFNLDKENYFAPTKEFTQLNISSKDSLSLQWHALKIYQELLSNYLQQNNIAGLIDADLQRLQFAYNYSTLNNKEELYRKALYQLATTHNKNEAAAQAYYTAIMTEINTPEEYGDSQVEKDNKNDYLKTSAALKELIIKYPGSEGAINAQNALNKILQQSLQLQLEEAYLPNENIKVLLSYKNIATVTFSIYTNNVSHARNKQYKGQFIKSWEQKLINSEDHKTHTAELKVDAIPIGLYTLEVRDNTGKIITSDLLQVSNLAGITGEGSQDQDNKLFVLNRKDGKFVPKPKLLYINYEYNKNSNTYVGTVKKEISGNQDGSIARTEQSNNYNTSFAINKDKDTFLIAQGNDYGLRYINKNNTEYNTQERAFFFTDRSIYRPGQTIYFKGIFLKSNSKKKHEVLQNKSVTVKFRDANYQIVKELQLKTNDFGSVSGSFVAPASGLTGTMSIGSEIGSVSFNVEEYKRPKFYVVIDSIKENVKLHEDVTINGKSLAYAGNNIDQASVKYRVVRKTRFPYSWLFRSYIPSSVEMEIANGTTTTNEQGFFSFDFKAIPDPTIEAKNMPVFNYEITVDVTDINGETRSEVAHINLGYNSLDIAIQAPSEALSHNLKTVNIYTRNLNGVFTPAKVEVSISPLEKAKKIYRKRLWDLPTDFIYDEATFHSFFPDDEYKNETSLEDRKRGAPIWSQQIESSSIGTLTIPSNLFQETGYFEIMAKAKDKDGKEVVQKQLVFVLHPGHTSNNENTLVALSEELYEPESLLKNYVVAGFDDINLIQKNSWHKKFQPNNGIINIPISVADRGYKSMNWLYVYNNRVYSRMQQISIPWSNKDLHIEWATHRDKVQPGAQEEWSFTIKGDKKELVAAELVAGLYDASLDALNPHNWYWKKLYGQDYEYFHWNKYGFGSKTSEAKFSSFQSENYIKSRPAWDLPQFINSMMVYGNRMDKRSYAGSIAFAAVDQEAMSPPPGIKAEEAAVGFRAANSAADSTGNKENTQNGQQANVTTRTNLQETAFFFPNLQTDANGNIKVKFTLPEALTEWKLMAFAHTQDWKTAYLSGTIKTQKELMVTPNLPRFFRQGDEVTIATKISNLTEKVQTGMVSIDLFDANTLEPLNETFGYKKVQQQFTALAQQSTVSNFTISIPDNLYQPVLVRVVANNESFSDGEEHIIPVVSNRMLVTETLPIAIRGNADVAFSFEKLLQAKSSNTLKHHRLTVEYTGNPAWYAVQALPYLIEFPYDCAEQTFSRFYANALAAHIVAQSPKVAAIFDQWKKVDTSALVSNLEKNQELKSALLEETPWVLQAQSETEQKKNIARLFEMHQLAKGLDNAISKLEKMQNSDGSFGWFSGMNGNNYITQYILTGIAKLQHLNVAAAQTKTVKNIFNKALQYADTELLKEYKQIKKENLDKNNLSYAAIQYLYLRSFSNTEIDKSIQVAASYYKHQCKKYWMHQSNMMQGMIALTAHRGTDKATANTIIESLSERAIRNKELGMYWNEARSYFWYQLPIETHALLITAFDEIQPNDTVVDDLKLWLLKQKQTQHWPTTTATADAVYALLQTGSDWLQNEPDVKINLGSWKIEANNTQKKSGTGYFSQSLSGNDIRPEMGNINVQVHNMASNAAASWGAVYWQYFENMDKLSHSGVESPLHISKQLFIEKHTDRGPVLAPISEQSPLKVGDKVKVRIVLKADRAMDYVHLKDMRAAGFEPVNVLSGYKWNQGLGYYESTKDLASHFFFDHLPKGTFVFEYAVYVAQKGKFSNGISTVQCMYAPEFNAHTEGIRVNIK